MQNENTDNKILGLDGKPLMETSPDKVVDAGSAPKQVPLSEIVGFANLRFSNLNEAAGMLNVIAAGKGKRRTVIKWETIPQMNKVSGQVEYTMLIEVKK